MFLTVKKLSIFLDGSAKKEAILLLMLMLVVSVLDAIGIASIMPLIMIIIDPEIINNNILIKPFWEFSQKIIGLNTAQFIVFFGIGLFFILILTLALRGALTFWQLNFSSRLEYKVSVWLMRQYLNLPYELTFQRSSSELGAKILTEVSTIIYQSLIPTLIIFTHSFVAIAMLLVLVVVDGYAAIIVGATLGFLYTVIVLLTRKKVDILGKERLLYNEERFSIFNQSIRGFKDIKLSNNEEIYLKRFIDASKPYAINWAKGQIIAQSPRYLIEAIAFGGMLLFLIYNSINNVAIINAFPNIALYALVSYRLLPSMQQIYSNLSNIQFAYPSLSAMHSEYIYFKNLKKTAEEKEKNINFAEDITVSEVSYKYPSTNNLALDKITIKIPERTSLAIIGETGSGKSTLVDVIMGLLPAANGAVLVGKQEINNANRRAWQKKIGYVPQNIFIFDISIAENIALGSRYDEINWDRLERVVEIANIKSFIENKLELGYRTSLGEDGIRLSGGEKQRIGIARALYNEPKILVLDEATSALDNDTETEVMSAIKVISQDIVVIMIAHRLNSVRDCDQLILLEEGRVKAIGTFEEIVG
jgi:ATP-binding cassette, subfamily B, bacterial PglK